jgi:hypothetical protein
MNLTVAGDQYTKFEPLAMKSGSGIATGDLVVADGNKMLKPFAYMVEKAHLHHVDDNSVDIVFSLQDKMTLNKGDVLYNSSLEEQEHISMMTKVEDFSVSHNDNPKMNSIANTVHILHKTVTDLQIYALIQSNQFQKLAFKSATGIGAGYTASSLIVVDRSDITSSSTQNTNTDLVITLTEGALYETANSDVLIEVLEGMLTDDGKLVGEGQSFRDLINSTLNVSLAEALLMGPSNLKIEDQTIPAERVERYDQSDSALTLEVNLENGHGVHSVKAVKDGVGSGLKAGDLVVLKKIEKKGGGESTTPLILELKEGALYAEADSGLYIRVGESGSLDVLHHGGQNLRAMSTCFKSGVVLYKSISDLDLVLESDGEKLTSIRGNNSIANGERRGGSRRGVGIGSNGILYSHGASPFVATWGKGAIVGGSQGPKDAGTEWCADKTEGETYFGSITNWTFTDDCMNGETESMFENCDALGDENLGGWAKDGTSTFPKFSSMANMFKNANYFYGNGLDKWAVDGVKYMDGAFHGAYKLSDTVDISSWNVDDVVDARNMFRGAVGFCGTYIGDWDFKNLGTDKNRTGNETTGAWEGMFFDACNLDMDFEQNKNNTARLGKFISFSKGAGIAESVVLSEEQRAAPTPENERTNVEVVVLNIKIQGTGECDENNTSCNDNVKGICDEVQNKVPDDINVTCDVESESHSRRLQRVGRRRLAGSSSVEIDITFSVRIPTVTAGNQSPEDAVKNTPMLQDLIEQLAEVRKDGGPLDEDAVKSLARDAGMESVDVTYEDSDIAKDAAAAHVSKWEDGILEVVMDIEPVDGGILSTSTLLADLGLAEGDVMSASIMIENKKSYIYFFKRKDASRIVTTKTGDTAYVLQFGIELTKEGDGSFVIGVGHTQRSADVVSGAFAGDYQGIGYSASSTQTLREFKLGDDYNFTSVRATRKMRHSKFSELMAAAKRKNLKIEYKFARPTVHFSDPNEEDMFFNKFQQVEGGPQTFQSLGGVSVGGCNPGERRFNGKCMTCAQLNDAAVKRCVGPYDPDIFRPVWEDYDYTKAECPEPFFCTPAPTNEPTLAPTLAPTPEGLPGANEGVCKPCSSYNKVDCQDGSKTGKECVYDSDKSTCSPKPESFLHCSDRNYWTCAQNHVCFDKGGALDTGCDLASGNQGLNLCGWNACSNTCEQKDKTAQFVMVAVQIDCFDVVLNGTCDSGTNVADVDWTVSIAENGVLPLRDMDMKDAKTFFAELVELDQKNHPHQSCNLYGDIGLDSRHHYGDAFTCAGLNQFLGKKYLAPSRYLRKDKQSKTFAKRLLNNNKNIMWGDVVSKLSNTALDALDDLVMHAIVKYNCQRQNALGCAWLEGEGSAGMCAGFTCGADGKFKPHRT